MKKLMLTITAGLMAVAVLADVTSQNAVGYVKVPVTQGFSLISVNFDNVENAEAGIDINDIFPPTTPGLTGATGAAGGADAIQVWDNDAKTYANYFLYYTTKTTSLSTLNWTWRVGQNTPANVQLKPGDVVWFNKKGATPVEFAIAGEVSAAAEREKVLTPGFNTIGNLYPHDWSANDLGTEFWAQSGAVGATGAAGGADAIQVWDNDAKTYANYFLYYTTKTTSLSTLNWTWRVGQNTLAPDGFLKVGAGAWYNAKSANTITLPLERPYAL